MGKKTVFFLIFLCMVWCLPALHLRVARHVCLFDSWIHFYTALYFIMEPWAVAIRYNWDLGEFYRFYSSPPKVFRASCLNLAFAFLYQQTWYAVWLCPKSVIAVSFLTVSLGSWDSLSHSATRSWFCWQQENSWFGGSFQHDPKLNLPLEALSSGGSTSSGVSIRSVFTNDFWSFKDEDSALTSVFWLCWKVSCKFSVFIESSPWHNAVLGLVSVSVNSNAPCCWGNGMCFINGIVNMLKDTNSSLLSGYLRSKKYCCIRITSNNIFWTT